LFKLSPSDQEAQVSLTEMAVTTQASAGEQRVPWRGVVEALDEVVLLLNAQYVVAYASPSVDARLGYTPQELTGQALGDLLHPDDLRAALRHLAELSAVGVARHAMRVRRADGDHTWLECTLTRTTPDGAGGGFIVLCGREGSTTANLEDRLAVVDRRYRTLMGSLAEGVVVVDDQLRVEEVNDEAAALIGWLPQELLGRRWFDVLDVWDENGQRQRMDSPAVVDLITTPAWHEVWRTVLRKDGAKVLVRTRWTPLAGGSAGHCGYVLTLQDVLGARGGASSLPQQRRQARTAAGLTPREHEVLELLADAQDAMDIALILELSVYSVRGHIKSLMRKLGVHSQLQAVVVAARRGIVDVVGGPSRPA
jgi:PAS domain S-box-containing protein